MRRQTAFCIAILVGVSLCLGCHRGPNHSTITESVSLPQFSSKNGILLPEPTRRSIGLKLIEVEERKLSSSLNFELQVYQIENDVAKASGILSTEQANKLKVGQILAAYLADGRTVTGKVTAFNSCLQRATGCVEVLLEMTQDIEGIIVGQFVQARVAGLRESLPAIPRSALLNCSEGNFVYTVNGEHLVRTAVKIGPMDDDFVGITDGLYAGDQVAVQPVMSLWMTELAAVKGGQACCIEVPKGK